MFLVFNMKQLRLDNVNIIVKVTIKTCSDNVHMSSFQSLLCSNGKKILIRYKLNDSSKRVKVIYLFVLFIAIYNSSCFVFQDVTFSVPFET